jgi:putative membrane protein
MRQLNFLLVFTFCLALVLFSLENTQSTTITILPGFEIQAPLAIELIITLGLGGVLAWLFGIWNRLLSQLSQGRNRAEIRRKDEQIEALTADLAQYQAQLTQQTPLLTEAKAENTETESKF